MRIVRILSHQWRGRLQGVKLPRIKPTHLAIAGGALLIWALLPKKRAIGAVLQAPVDAPVTSAFGWRVHPTEGVPRKHSGVDFGAALGTPVAASSSGTIRHKVTGHSTAGNYLEVDHGNDVTTRYLHLDRFAPNLSLGTAVKAGQIIGYVGATGRVTGPHLHFEVSVNGEAIDPMEVIAVA